MVGRAGVGAVGDTGRITGVTVSDGSNVVRRTRSLSLDPWSLKTLKVRLIRLSSSWASLLGRTPCKRCLLNSIIEPSPSSKYSSWPLRDCLARKTAFEPIVTETMAESSWMSSLSLCRPRYWFLPEQDPTVHAWKVILRPRLSEAHPEHTSANSPTADDHPFDRSSVPEKEYEHPFGPNKMYCLPEFVNTFSNPFTSCSTSLSRSVESLGHPGSRFSWSFSRVFLPPSIDSPRRIHRPALPPGLISWSSQSPIV